MYYISQIYLQNFISHKNSIINIDTQTDRLIFINGITDDPFKSNGAGKSAIYYGLLFNIFGSVPNRTLEELLNKNVDENTYVVSVIYHSSEKILQIIRTVTITNSVKHELKIIENDKELMFQKKEFAQQYIEKELLGVNKDLFYTTNFLTSENLSILSFSPVQRTKLFETVLNISILNDLFNTVNADLKSLKNTISTLENNKKIYQEERERNIKLKEFSIHSNQLEYDKKISEYDTKIKEIDDKIALLNIEYTNLMKKYKSIDNIDKQLKVVDNAIKEIDTTLLNTQSKYNSLVSIRNEKSILISKNKCPTCGRSIDDKFRMTLNKLIESLDIKNLKLQNGLNTLKTTKSKLIQIQTDLLNAKDKFSKLSEKIEYLSNEKSHLVEYRQKITESISKNDIFLRIDTNIQDLTDKINNVDEELSKHQETLEMLETLYKLLSPKSNFRNSYISKYLEVINYISNKYINIFYPNGNIQMSIKYDTETQKIYTQFVFNGTEINYNLLSKGERKKMDIVFYFSLIEYLYNYTKNSINLGIFIADETFDGLDNTSMMLLLDLLNAVKQSTNIQFFMTSHNNSLSLNVFDKIITVVKDESTGISTII